MKGVQVVIGQFRGRSAAARLVDGAVDDLIVAPPDSVPLPEAIYRAEVARPLKGAGGCFVTWPGGTGFLRDAKGARPGTRTLVQVTGYAEKGKAAPVTRRVLIKGRYGIVSRAAPGLNLSRAIRDPHRRDALQTLAAAAALPEGAGLILRTAAEAAPDEAIGADLAALAGLAMALSSDAGETPELLLEGPDPAAMAHREWMDGAHVVEATDAFESLDLLDRIAALLECSQRLPGGGAMTIEATRALVAVDVDTGADTTPAAGLKANLATARALPAALRLRGLGGQITIDFAPMPKKDRRQVEAALRSAFRADPVETTLVGWTPLGHFELQRKRERYPVRGEPR